MIWASYSTRKFDCVCYGQQCRKERDDCTEKNVLQTLRNNTVARVKRPKMHCCIGSTHCFSLQLDFQWIKVGRVSMTSTMVYRRPLRAAAVKGEKSRRQLDAWAMVRTLVATRGSRVEATSLQLTSHRVASVFYCIALFQIDPITVKHRHDSTTFSHCIYSGQYIHNL